LLLKLDLFFYVYIIEEKVTLVSFNVLLLRWWWDIDLSRKLKFSRDRLVEIFIWALAVFPEPQFAYYRKVISKLTILIPFIDDIYDIYGTLEELELFTNVIARFVQLISNEVQFTLLLEKI